MYLHRSGVVTTFRSKRAKIVRWIWNDGVRGYRRYRSSCMHGDVQDVRYLFRLSLTDGSRYVICNTVRQRWPSNAIVEDGYGLKSRFVTVVEKLQLLRATRRAVGAENLRRRFRVPSQMRDGGGRRTTGFLQNPGGH